MYLMYRNATPVALDEPVKVQEANGHIIGAVKMGTMEPNHAGAGLGAVGKVWFHHWSYMKQGKDPKKKKKSLKEKITQTFNYFTEWGHI